MTSYRITHLAGRCRSGSDRAGQVCHAVDRTGNALCGVQPGRTSAGWSEYDDKEITCLLCALAAGIIQAAKDLDDE